MNLTSPSSSRDVSHHQQMFQLFFLTQPKSEASPSQESITPHCRALQCHDKHNSTRDHQKNLETSASQLPVSDNGSPITSQSVHTLQSQQVKHSLVHKDQCKAFLPQSSFSLDVQGMKKDPYAAYENAYSDTWCNKTPTDVPNGSPGHVVAVPNGTPHYGLDPLELESLGVWNAYSGTKVGLTKQSVSPCVSPDPLLRHGSTLYSDKKNRLTDSPKGAAVTNYHLNCSASEFLSDTLPECRSPLTQAVRQTSPPEVQSQQDVYLQGGEKTRHQELGHTSRSRGKHPHLSLLALPDIPTYGSPLWNASSDFDDTMPWTTPFQSPSSETIFSKAQKSNGLDAQEILKQFLDCLSHTSVDDTSAPASAAAAVLRSAHGKNSYDSIPEQHTSPLNDPRFTTTMGSTDTSRSRSHVEPDTPTVTHPRPMIARPPDSLLMNIRSASCSPVSLANGVGCSSVSPVSQDQDLNFSVTPASFVQNSASVLKNMGYRKPKHRPGGPDSQHDDTYHTFSSKEQKAEEKSDMGYTLYITEMTQNTTVDNASLHYPTSKGNDEQKSSSARQVHLMPPCLGIGNKTYFCEETSQLDAIEKKNKKKGTVSACYGMPDSPRPLRMHSSQKSPREGGNAELSMSSQSRSSTSSTSSAPPSRYTLMLPDAFRKYNEGDIHSDSVTPMADNQKPTLLLSPPAVDAHARVLPYGSQASYMFYSTSAHQHPYEKGEHHDEHSVSRFGTLHSVDAVENPYSAGTMFRRNASPRAFQPHYGLRHGGATTQSPLTVSRSMDDTKKPSITRSYTQHDNPYRDVNGSATHSLSMSLKRHDPSLKFIMQRQSYLDIPEQTLTFSAQHQVEDNIFSNPTGGFNSFFHTFQNDSMNPTVSLTQALPQNSDTPELSHPSEIKVYIDDRDRMVYVSWIPKKARAYTSTEKRKMELILKRKLREDLGLKGLTKVLLFPPRGVHCKLIFDCRASALSFMSSYGGCTRSEQTERWKAEMCRSYHITMHEQFKNTNVKIEWSQK